MRPLSGGIAESLDTDAARQATSVIKKTGEDGNQEKTVIRHDN